MVLWVTGDNHSLVVVAVVVVVMWVTCDTHAVLVAVAVIWLDACDSKKMVLVVLLVIL